MKKLIKLFFKKAGIDIHKLSTTSSSAFQLLKGLELFNVDLVFDIGANIGQFAKRLRDVGYDGRKIGRAHV